MNYLSVENASKSYGTKVLFENISFGINKGQKVAFIARNGSGKSTLLKSIFGIETLDKGNIVTQKDLKISYLGQEEIFDESLDIMQTIFNSDNPKLEAVRNYNEALESGNDDTLTKTLEAMEHENAWDVEAQVKEVLFQLKLVNIHQKINKLSGGQKKRVALAKCLLEYPDFMVLDEPTNHLDIEMIEWLEGYLTKEKVTLFMVTHDRYFLEIICTEILELDRGKIHKYTGNYSYYLEKRAARIEVENVNIGKAKNLMRKELEWIRRQPKARTTKSKARIDAFDVVKNNANKTTNQKNTEIEVNMTRLGTKIVEFHNVSKSFGDLKILEKFNYSFRRGEHLGIMGKNGSGKSTFLNILTDQSNMDTGKVVHGETLVLGYYNQAGMKFKENQRVIDVIKDIAEVIPLKKGRKITASQMLERFLFTPEEQYTYVRKLSGGERRRLHLLTVFMKNPNFLILDEPTNDLDIYTLNVLEDYLSEYEGCLIVVTHDRYFMDRIAHHLFVFEGDAKIKDFAGNYSEYLAYEKRENKEINKKKEPKVIVKKETPIIDKKVKFGFNEKREFGILEIELPKLEKIKQDLMDALSNPDLSAEELTQKSLKLGKIMDELECKTERWFELSELAEV